MEKAQLRGLLLPTTCSLHGRDFSPAKPNTTLCSRVDGALIGLSETNITLEFFTPIIKDNYRETSLPASLFQFRIHNPSSSPVDFWSMSAMAMLRQQCGDATPPVCELQWPG
jgi:hypothetical protein